MAKSDGGPAFPRTGKNTVKNMDGGWVEGHSGHPGMSLRDYFAGPALTGILMDCDLSRMGYAVAKAYEAADLMLKEREAEDGKV